MQLPIDTVAPKLKIAPFWHTPGTVLTGSNTLQLLLWQTIHVHVNTFVISIFSWLNFSFKATKESDETEVIQQMPRGIEIKELLGEHLTPESGNSHSHEAKLYISIWLGLLSHQVKYVAFSQQVFIHPLLYIVLVFNTITKVNLQVCKPCIFFRPYRMQISADQLDQEKQLKTFN